MEGKSREAETLNNRIEAIRLAILQSFRSLEASGRDFDATDIKEHFQGMEQSRGKLIERLDLLIEEKKSHVGIDLCEGTLHGYHSTRLNLVKFIRARFNVEDLAFSQITENFITDFKEYYLGTLGYRENSFNTLAHHLKAVCKLAYEEGLADTLLFANVKVSRGETKSVKALDRTALEKIAALTFEEFEEELSVSRDAFLFACHIGAAYCDLMSVSKEHLCLDDEGHPWLKFKRHKTGVLCRIKLLPEAVRIIGKYKSDERETLLPHIPYDRYMDCLKAIRMRAGISMAFTSHTARHTFATLVTLEQGVPIETVSKMLGHSNVSMTERYAKVTPQKIFAEFDRFMEFTETITLTL